MELLRETLGYRYVKGLRPFKDIRALNKVDEKSIKI